MSRSSYGEFRELCARLEELFSEVAASLENLQESTGRLEEALDVLPLGGDEDLSCADLQIALNEERQKRAALLAALKDLTEEQDGD